MYTDWTKHSDSSTDLYAVRVTAGAPPGGGINYLKVPAASLANAGVRRVAYRNDLLGTIAGRHQVSGALRLTAGSYPVQIGLIALWSGNTLDSFSAFVLELQGISTGTNLVLRRGPHPDGEVIESVAGPALGVWTHVLLQIAYDRVGNQQIVVATDVPSVHPITAPVWTSAMTVYTTPRQEAIRSGKTGFIVRSNKGAFEADLDLFRVETTLEEVT